MNDVALNKIQSIQRCVARAREEYSAAAGSFDSDFTRQDAAILNVIRACEQSIDLCNHVVRVQRLGVPVSSVESFELLERKGIIDGDLGDRLRNMVRFRNIVVHNYQTLDVALVESVITNGLDDLLRFADTVRGEF